MFENIVGYTALTSYLTKLVNTKALPSAMLLSAPAFSGKSSCALELARGILCENDRAKKCLCSQCTYVRLLENENIAFLGRREFIIEIKYAEQLLKTYKDPAAYMFFYSAITKLLRRVDDFLWDGIGVWGRELKAAAYSLRELLDEYRAICVKYCKGESITPNDTIKFSASKVQKIVKHAEKLHSSLPTYMLPVQLLRNVITWANISSHGKAKIILLENAEMLQEASASTLLKILEEPPENVFFILTSTRISALLPTILSRVRVISFPKRSKEDEKKVIEKIFRNQDASFHAGSVANFLINTEKKLENYDISAYAEKYLTMAMEKKAFKESYICKENGQLSRSDGLLFLQNLEDILHSMLVGSNLPPQVLKVFLQDCVYAAQKVKVRNLSPKLVLECLYYSLRKKALLYKYETFI